jgi:hypothetical protein
MDDDRREANDEKPARGGRDTGMWVWAVAFLLFIIMTIYIPIVPSI